MVVGGGGRDNDDGLNGSEMEGLRAWGWTAWQWMGKGVGELVAQRWTAWRWTARRLGSSAVLQWTGDGPVAWRLGGLVAWWLGGLAAWWLGGLAAWWLDDGQLGGLGTSGVGQGRGEESMMMPFCLHVSLKLPMSCVASRV